MDCLKLLVCRTDDRLEKNIALGGGEYVSKADQNLTNCTHFFSYDHLYNVDILQEELDISKWHLGLMYVHCSLAANVEHNVDL